MKKNDAKCWIVPNEPKMRWFHCLPMSHFNFLLLLLDKIVHISPSFRMNFRFHRIHHKWILHRLETLNCENTVENKRNKWIVHCHSRAAVHKFHLKRSYATKCFNLISNTIIADHNIESVPRVSRLIVDVSSGATVVSTNASFSVYGICSFKWFDWNSSCGGKLGTTNCNDTNSNKTDPTNANNSKLEVSCIFTLRFVLITNDKLRSFSLHSGKKPNTTTESAEPIPTVFIRLLASNELSNETKSDAYCFIMHLK